MIWLLLLWIGFSSRSFYYPSYLNETKYYVVWSKNIQMNEKEWMKKIQDNSILMIFIQIKNIQIFRMHNSWDFHI